MRLRNVKHAKDTIEEHPQYVIANPQKHKGHWNRVFLNDNPVEIEIGCGKGKFIHEMAKKHPDINFIGIEKFDSVIIRALEKMIEEPLDNLRLIRIDAEHVEAVFKKREISKIYLNFSDPWPKNRAAKRRLTSNRFLQRYKHILKPDSEIVMKTDNFPLYQFSMMELNHHELFRIEEMNLNLYRTFPFNNIQTEFEQKFVEKGNLIFFLKARYIGE